jgi:hypothetical protein
MLSTPDEPQVLKPFSRAESRTTEEAAAFCGRTRRTMRNWCTQYNLGRRIGGAWVMSIVALDLFVNDEQEALRHYLSGDRRHPTVVAAYERHRVSVPKRSQADNAENATYHRTA